MLDLLLSERTRRATRILCIGAHCDDIEIGCGAALRVLQRQARGAVIDWVILGGTAKRRAEAQQSMRMLVRPACRGRLQFGDFADGVLPAAYREVKGLFESLKRRPTPDLILCHEREDRHQDHRLVNEMVWSTFRDHLILEYEIPKWDGGLGQPNVYIPVSRRDVARKLDTLMKCYASQSDRDWFTRETFLALLRLRGIECRAPSGYAEAFHGRKIHLAT
jgi:LmbE family N-acetylglucosaminyl deacetylase